MLYAQHRINEINKNAPEYIAHLMSDEHQELLASIARKHMIDIRHTLHQSKFAVILAYANTDTADLLDPYSRGYKLREYTPEGQEKIAKAIRGLREIVNEFPANITIADFKKIDKGVSYAKSTN